MTQNRKFPVILGLSALGLLLLVILLVISVRMNHNQRDARAASREIIDLSRASPVKNDDIFLPGEPDFIPEVLMDREPRDAWTDADAEPFWKDPLEGNEAIWKKRIHAAVDALLENVP